MTREWRQQPAGARRSRCGKPSNELLTRLTEGYGVGEKQKNVN